MLATQYCKDHFTGLDFGVLTFPVLSTTKCNATLDHREIRFMVLPVRFANAALLDKELRHTDFECRIHVSSPNCVYFPHFIFLRLQVQHMQTSSCKYTIQFLSAQPTMFTTPSRIRLKRTVRISPVCFVFSLGRSVAAGGHFISTPSQAIDHAGLSFQIHNAGGTPVTNAVGRGIGSLPWPTEPIGMFCASDESAS